MVYVLALMDKQTQFRAGHALFLPAEEAEFRIREFILWEIVRILKANTFCNALDARHVCPAIRGVIPWRLTNYVRNRQYL